MFKLAISLVVAALGAASAYGQTIPVGELCSGIAGPLPYPCKQLLRTFKFMGITEVRYE
ncbi:hypothetical protein JR316_0008924 [Psilocybe cubensis]|uniref:Uncharacterized protein n=2 Tax=Psilocybe cubensis TaxID=181762 RepID=A0A8H8CK81_PSICU|nr:hypothetical protein JR316_0008924 [Psilocybe cubensis]KAH9478469.1 hypothetical protein JR316_0008924 [Psilocybe cubensis]